MATINLDRFRDVDLVIDKANDNFIQKQWVSTGDREGRTLTVMVTDGGVVGEIAGVTASLLWTNQSNGLTDEHAFVLKDKATSTFVIEYPTNMLTPGTVIAQIRVWYDGKTITTKPFEITVSGIAGEMKGIVAQQEFGLLTAVLADANKLRSDIDKKADRSYVDAVLSSIAAGGPRELFYSLAALKAKYPQGAEGTYLVFDVSHTNGAHSYMWKDGSWVDLGVYQGLEIADKSIDYNKIMNNTVDASNLMFGAVSQDNVPFARKNENSNLFDQNSSRILHDKMLHGGNIVDLVNYRVTHPIFLKGGSKVYFNNPFANSESVVRSAHLVNYNNNMIIKNVSQYVEKDTIANTDHFFPPVDGYYRFNMYNATLDDFGVYLTSNAYANKIPFEANLLTGFKLNADDLKQGTYPLEMLDGAIIDDYYRGDKEPNKLITINKTYFTHESETACVSKKIFLREGDYSVTYYDNLGSNSTLGALINTYNDNILDVIKPTSFDTTNKIATYTINTAGYYRFNFLNGKLGNQTFDPFHIIKGGFADFLASPKNKGVYLKNIKVTADNIVPDIENIKKWAIIGDSLSDKSLQGVDQKLYFDYINENNRFHIFDLAQKDTGYVRKYSSNEHFLARINNNLTTLKTMDLITLMGSFNDLTSLNNQEISGLVMGNARDTTNTSIAGIINQTLDVLQSECIDSELLVISPLPWGRGKPLGGVNWGTPPIDTTESRSLLQKEYVELLGKICQLRSIPFLDMYNESNMRPWISAFNDKYYMIYTPTNVHDTIHPNTLGHQKFIAPKIRSKIKSILGD